MAEEREILNRYRAEKEFKEYCFLLCNMDVIMASTAKSLLGDMAVRYARNCNDPKILAEPSSRFVSEDLNGWTSYDGKFLSIQGCEFMDWGAWLMAVTWHNVQALRLLGYFDTQKKPSMECGL